MSAKPRTTPRDLVLPVPLARRPGAKTRRLPPNVPVVRIPLENTVISKTACTASESLILQKNRAGFEPEVLFAAVRGPWRRAAPRAGPGE